MYFIKVKLQIFNKLNSFPKLLKVTIKMVYKKIKQALTFCYSTAFTSIKKFTLNCKRYEKKIKSEVQ